MSNAAANGVPAPVARVERVTEQPPSSLPVSAGGSAHLPVESQTLGETQSATAVQSCLHAPVESHVYGAHS